MVKDLPPSKLESSSLGSRILVIKVSNSNVFINISPGGELLFPREPNFPSR